MSEVEIEIAYVVDAVDQGVMEISDLAPAVLSFEALFKEANFVLNGDGVRHAWPRRDWKAR
jgi:hypothetical protein